MKRSERKTLAEETVEIIQRGHYTAPSGRLVNISDDVNAAKHATILYEAASLPQIESLSSEEINAALEVTTESTFAAIQRLASESTGTIGCLNFASAKNPGGGFLNGSEAQEEALSRASALYACLLCAPAYYERHRNHHSCLYLDLIIVSPNVPFIRNDDGTLLENPATATVITAPAPNAGAVAQNEAAHAHAVEPTLRRRAELVLRASAAQGVKLLVLGAWGCGVFRNDPAVVARAFADLLKPGCSYAKAFRKVVFAVFDPTGAGPNYIAFKEVFA